MLISSPSAKGWKLFATVDLLAWQQQCYNKAWRRNQQAGRVEVVSLFGPMYWLLLPENYYFYYDQKYVWGQSIPKIFYLILKKKTMGRTRWGVAPAGAEFMLGHSARVSPCKSAGACVSMCRAGARAWLLFLREVGSVTAQKPQACRNAYRCLCIISGVRFDPGSHSWWAEWLPTTWTSRALFLTLSYRTCAMHDCDASAHWIEIYWLTHHTAALAPARASAAPVLYQPKPGRGFTRAHVL